MRSVRRRRSLLVLAALGLVSGIAIARAAPKTKAPGARLPTAACVEGSPTKEVCLAKGYLQGCAKHRKACEPFVLDGIKEHRESAAYKSAPSAKMLRPGMDAIPQSVRTGKVFAYKPPAKTSIGPSSNGLFSRTGLTGPAVASKAASAKKHHRSPNWEKNGDQVASCEEYAYEQMYDWTRFTDASAACRDDWQCQLEIAYEPSAPGIAYRKLERKDGRALAHQIDVKSKGKVTKNDLFVFDSNFIENIARAGGPKLTSMDHDKFPRTPEIDGLIKALEQGHDFYSYGCKTKTCGDRKFSNEWAFHETMSNKHAAVSTAEFEEYERRRNEFNRLLAEWGVAVMRTADKALKKSNKIEKVFEHPLTHVITPEGRVEFTESTAQMLAKNRAVFESKAKAVGINPAGLSKGKIQQLQGNVPQYHGALEFLRRETDATEDGVNSPVGVLAAPMPAKPMPRTRPASTAKPTTSTAKPMPRASTGASTASAVKKVPLKPKWVDECAAWGNEETDAEIVGVGPHSCRLGQFLRREWARKAAGEISCLDLGNSVCDWSPMAFQRRFVEGAPYLARQAEYETECKDWMPSISPKKDLATNKSLYPKLAVLESEILDIQKDAEEAMEQLAPYAERNGTKITSIGRAFRERDAWGDKGWVAAGYDTKFDWKVAVSGRKDGQACELSGHAGGGFDLDTWLIGNKVTLLAGASRGKLNGKAKKLELDANLRVFGISVFNEGVKTDLVYAPEPNFKSPGKITNPPPQWTVMAGPVPISGAVWAEVMYGVGFRAEGVANSPTCDINDVKFGIKTTLAPMFKFSVFGQIGVGVTGVLSAGVRGMLNLLTIAVPLSSGLTTNFSKTSSGQKVAQLEFDVAINLLMGTLSGKLMLYIEVLGFEETWELFRWKGLETKIPLMDPLGVELPLVSWK